jgi:hypothetical protein
MHAEADDAGDGGLAGTPLSLGSGPCLLLKEEPLGGVVAGFLLSAEAGEAG